MHDSVNPTRTSMRRTIGQKKMNNQEAAESAPPKHTQKQNPSGTGGTENKPKGCAQSQPCQEIIKTSTVKKHPMHSLPFTNTCPINRELRLNRDF
jgi:hypothetical protein